MTIEYTLAYPDGNSLLLFNPYHDERGRFTSKERAVSISSLAHPPDKVTTKSGDDYTEAMFSGWDTSVMVVGPALDPEDPGVQEMQTAIAAASNALDVIGVQGKPTLIVAHTSNKTFDSAFRRIWGFNIPSDHHLGGFADVENDRIHIAPAFINDLRSRFSKKGPLSEYGLDMEKAIDNVAHELFHLRQGSSKKTVGALEEGLTTIAGILSAAYQGVGDYSLKNNKVMNFFLRLSSGHPYSVPINAVMDAAQNFAKKPNVFADWEDVIIKWMKLPAIEARRKMLENVGEWFKDFYGPRLETNFSDDIILLFNPYHDEKGRFTTKQGAVNISGLPGAADADLTIKKKGEHFAVFLGDECDIVEHLDPNVYGAEDREILTRGVALAQHGLNKVGIYRPRDTIQRVHLYDSFKEFLGQWGPGGDPKKIPRAWNEGNQSYIGPDATFDIFRDMQTMERPTIPVGWKDIYQKTMWRMTGIGTAAHELYHAWMRNRIDNYQGWVEEGLASSAAGMVKTGLLTGDFHIRTDEGRTAFNKFLNKPGIYRPFMHAIRNAAQVKARERGGENWHQALSRWVRFGYDPNNIEDILSVPLPEWLVEDIWESIGKMEWVPDDTVLLFNPYHDEKGRFTSKERAVNVSAHAESIKEKLGKHIDRFKSISVHETEDGIEALFSGEHYTGAVTVPGDLPKEKIAEIHAAVGLANNALHEIGVESIGKHIKFYNKNDRYYDALRKMTGKQEVFFPPQAFVDHDQVSHIGPESSHFIMQGLGTSLGQALRDSYVGIIAHELFHGRKTGGDWTETTGGKKYLRIEEGLASLAEVLTHVGLQTKDYVMRLGSSYDLTDWLIEQHPYSELRNLKIAAQNKAFEIDQFGSAETIAKILLRWVRKADKGTFDEIFEARGIPWNRWEKVDEDTILLFNPYHDERGRFTSKERATFIGQISNVKKVSEKETEDGIEALFSGDHYTGSITVPGNLDKEDIKELHNTVALAQEALHGIGVKGAAKHIRFITSWRKWDAFNPGANWDAMVDENNIAQISPRSTMKILDYVRGYSEDLGAAMGSVGNVIHELYHGRVLREKRYKLPFFIEEGLAALCDTLGKYGIKTGDFRLEKPGSERAFEDLILTGIKNYPGEAQQIYYAALRRQNVLDDAKWTKILVDWIQRGDYEAGNEILKWAKWPEEHIPKFEIEDDAILLFNPYHDVKGRFTDRQHAKGQLSENKLHLHGEIDQRTTFRAADATQLAAEKMKADPLDLHIYDNMDDFIKDSCAKASDKKECITRASNSYASYVNGAIRISPAGVAAIAKDRTFGERIINHETWHSRKRKGGAIGPTFKSKNKFDNYMRRDIEEATTDLLSIRSVGGKPMYSNQMGAIAMMIGQVYNWDKDKAWKAVDNLHFNINNDKFIDQLLTDFTGGTPSGGWTPEIKYALLAELMQASGDNNHAALAWLLGG